MPGIALRAEEREEIRAGIERDETYREIGRRRGRPASTVQREVKRNGGRRRYSATKAHGRAEMNKARPKPFTFELDRDLARRVEAHLQAKDSLKGPTMRSLG